MTCYFHPWKRCTLCPIVCKMQLSQRKFRCENTYIPSCCVFSPYNFLVDDKETQQDVIMNLIVYFFVLHLTTSLLFFFWRFLLVHERCDRRWLVLLVNVAPCPLPRVRKSFNTGDSGGIVTRPAAVHVLAPCSPQRLVSHMHTFTITHTQTHTVCATAVRLNS